VFDVKKTTGKIKSIEALRFFAAFLVVLYHCYYNLPVGAGLSINDLTGPVTWFKNGSVGVDIFFVISGFVMYAAVASKPVFSALSFMSDRFWRIYPVLWAVLIAKLMLELMNIALGIGALDTEAFTLPRIIGQFLLVPMPLEYLLIGPTWTLSLEVIFYAVFSLGFLLGGLRGVAIGVLTWFAAGLIYNHVLGGPEPLLDRLFQTLVIEFLYGVIIAHFYLKRTMTFGKLALAAGFTMLFISTFFLGKLAHFPVAREYVAGIPAAIMIYGLISTNYSAPRWLTLCGRSSYLLYLTHDMVLGVTAGVIGMVFKISFWEHEVLIVIPVVAAVIVALLLNVYLENPFQKWRRDRKRAKLAQVEVEIAAGHGSATAVRTKAVAGDG
jgi:exopolysaccharide production protein ExoZ